MRLNRPYGFRPVFMQALCGDCRPRAGILDAAGPNISPCPLSGTFVELVAF